MVDNSREKEEVDMNTTKQFLVRAESFDIASPLISIEAVSTDITIMESLDAKSHLEILATTEGAKALAELITVNVSERTIKILAEKRLSGFKALFKGNSGELEIIMRLPRSSELTITNVSGDVTVGAAIFSHEVSTVSGNIEILKNPISHANLKTVSGDISARTFTGCRYFLKSISGDIRVHVAPNLEITVDGSSLSGDLRSEIALNSEAEREGDHIGSVDIEAKTVSGDFTLARN